MPAFNGMGPNGMGPMTGRCQGPCSGGMAHGFGFGRGCGQGRAMGRKCFGFGWDNIDPAEEEAYLKTQKDAIEKRLNELKKQD